MFLAREWYVAVRGGNYTRKGSQARREDLKKEKENLKLEEENLSKRKIMLYKKGILSKIKKHNNWSRRKKKEKKLKEMKTNVEVVVNSVSLKSLKLHLEDSHWRFVLCERTANQP